jgi:hypothetical protein
MMANEARAWSREETIHLYQGRLARKPYTLIAAELGRHEEAVRDKFRRTDFGKMGLLDEVAEAGRFEERSEYTGKIINQLDRNLNVFKMRADAIADVFERAIERLPKVEKSIWRPSKTTARGEEEDVGLLMSDIHIGHEHTLEETGGLSEYNMSKFRYRMNNLTLATKQIIDLHSRMYRLPRLHVMALGDIVAGMNAAGSWSPLYIASPIVDQMIGGFEAISEFLYYFLPFFDEIHFYGIGGNHGRSAPAGIQKEHDNWDYVCYKFLETAFRNNPRVKFHVPKSWWMMEKIRGHNFLMVHGDHTKGGGALKAIANFEQKMGGILKEKPDFTVFGHFHNAAEMTTSGGKIIGNGSFVGSDVYCLRDVHASSVPEQKIFGINDTHGITWRYDINLDTERGSK